ncbi:MAG TPA: preprotein translocase subunit SecG [Actinomycetota bacterium]|nr:preprotein translocase subunit SecG [Actinomycetota bacterium]
MLFVTVLVLDIMSALFLIVFILLHSGKGGGLSDMFGGGAGLSGGTAVEKRLDKITVFTACLFGLCTFLLAYLSNN